MIVDARICREYQYTHFLQMKTICNSVFTAKRGAALCHLNNLFPTICCITSSPELPTDGYPSVLHQDLVSLNGLDMRNRNDVGFMDHEKLVKFLVTDYGLATYINCRDLLHIANFVKGIRIKDNKVGPVSP